MSAPAIPLRFLCLLILGLLLYAVNPAYAAPEMSGKDPKAQFEAMDTDKDGKVSRKEFSDAFPQMRDAAFDAIDKNKDGSISLEEWQDFVKGHGGAMGGGMGGAMGGGMGMPSSGMGGGMSMPPAGMGASAAPTQESKENAVPGKAPDLIMPSSPNK